MTLPSTSPPTLSASSLEPPLGYRPLAWVGLASNILVIPFALAVILADPSWRTAHIAVGAGAVLPCAAVGIIASVALLQWRHWGWGVGGGREGPFGWWWPLPQMNSTTAELRIPPPSPDRPPGSRFSPVVLCRPRLTAMETLTCLTTTFETLTLSVSHTNT